MNSDLLINDLSKRTYAVIEKAELWLDLSDAQLNFKPAADSWSLLECIEHLNRYGRFYLPEIEQRIQGSSHASDDFKSGWLGDYFAKSMLPKEKLNKMKTFKVMDPAGSSLSRSVIQEFLDQQKQMLQLLRKSSKISLTKTKTSISISPLIKLRLGDTFRVVVYHNERHLVQAEKALNKALTLHPAI